MLIEIENWLVDLEWIDLAIAATLLSFELIRDTVTRRISWNSFLDIIASLSTQIPFFFTGLASIAFAIPVYYTLQYFAPFQLPVNVWTLALAVVVADFAYYWEHRVAHRVRLLWFSHAVHHSSPFMNTAVALRFGPGEAFTSLPFHAPLILLGFDPILVLFGELIVLVYQVWLHTELIGKLGILDKIFNTPSNHRVHHGSDTTYLDKNYGGILMVWDQLFGTYQREIEKPVYGLTKQINSNNPVTVWFSEVPGLVRDLSKARSFSEVCGYLFKPPGWQPD
jgi:sterol desaturase/sphingolipid hydroxylase (fatty acid hydroxylase superfamily)